jgi:hypothetical protein
MTPPSVIAPPLRPLGSKARSTRKPEKWRRRCQAINATRWNWSRAARRFRPCPLGPFPLVPARDTKRIEMMLGASNVTNYLDISANSPPFEYLVTALYDPPDTLHDASPIDESVAGMKKEKFACVGSQRVTWDAGVLKGTAPDRVTITERYVVECVGDCKGVFYKPDAAAQVIPCGQRTRSV